jgi:hypothetical protein
MPDLALQSTPICGSAPRVRAFSGTQVVSIQATESIVGASATEDFRPVQAAGEIGGMADVLGR